MEKNEKVAKLTQAEFIILKEMDLAEVQQGTMSKKAYMQKWRKLSDDEAEKELQQMAIERQYEDTAYFPVNSVLQQKEKEEI